MYLVVAAGLLHLLAHDRLADAEHPLRFLQHELRHVRVELVQLGVGDVDGAHLRVQVGYLRYPDPVLTGLEELLPARGEVLIGIIDRQNEHLLWCKES